METRWKSPPTSALLLPGERCRENHPDFVSDHGYSRNQRRLAGSAGTELAGAPLFLIVPYEPAASVIPV